MTQLSDWRKRLNNLLDTPDIKEALVVEGMARGTAAIVAESKGVIARRSVAPRVSAPHVTISNYERK